MKSYVNFLQGLYAAIFSSIAERIPCLCTDVSRDRKRLLDLVASRGLSFLAIDLPDAGKHFDKCLAHGHLTRFGIAGFRPYRRGGVIPRLFKGTFLRVFHESGELRADPDIDSIRILRQLLYGAKKVKVECEQSRTWEHVNDFFKIDQKVRSPSLNWDDDDFDVGHVEELHLGDVPQSGIAPLFGHTDFQYPDVEESVPRPEFGAFDAVQRTADIVSSLLGRFEPSAWRPKHGPGAVADQRHTQFKYDFPNWSSKLDHIFPMSELGFPNYTYWVDMVTDDGDTRFKDHEPPSKLISVPKSLKGPRLIAAEPVSHQWCQQIILDFLVSRLAYTPISRSVHFRDQTENQKFAREASHTESHVTVDLSSASDRLSTWVVERQFRRNPTLLSALHASRTRWVYNPIDKRSPTYARIRKFACMGSACTFPVQTIVFTCLAIGATLFSRGTPVSIASIRRCAQEVRVFGDDIIIPKDAWETLQGLLCHLGLKVNPNKTFFTGRFRESCGLDAFDGHDVTPTYSMTYPDVSRPESIMSCVATATNFIKSGWLTPMQYIKSRVERLERFTIPFVPLGSGLFGWPDVFSEGNPRVKTRWNPYLQKRQYRVHKPKSSCTWDLPNSDNLLLQFFTVSHRPSLVLGDRIGVAGRASTKLCRSWETLESSS